MHLGPTKLVFNFKLFLEGMIVTYLGVQGRNFSSEPSNGFDCTPGCIIFTIRNRRCQPMNHTWHSLEYHKQQCECRVLVNSQHNLTSLSLFLIIFVCHMDKLANTIALQDYISISQMRMSHGKLHSVQKQTC